jgi:hypothetical protein
MTERSSLNGNQAQKAGVAKGSVLGFRISKAKGKLIHLIGIGNDAHHENSISNP